MFWVIGLGGLEVMGGQKLYTSAAGKNLKKINYKTIYMKFSDAVGPIAMSLTVWPQ